MPESRDDRFSSRPFPESFTPPAEERRTGSAFRWVLPIGLFVVIVGAIAWVSQNLPKGAVTKQPEKTQPTNVEKPGDLRFARTKALWDADDPDYLKEYEQGVEGHYDFPFLNPTNAPVTLGFGQTSCDCSNLKVVVLDKAGVAGFAKILESNPPIFPSDSAWSWTTLTQGDKDGVEVPPQGGGVVRIGWNGRKNPGQRLRLNIKMWMQPPGKVDERAIETLEVPLIMAEAVRFSTEKLNLGGIGPGGVLNGEIIVWSPTRDRFVVNIDKAKLDPLFQLTVTPMDSADVKSLEQMFRDGKESTRVRSAHRLKITLLEQAGTLQIDQGPFARKLPLSVDGLPFDLHVPTVTANVRGDVEIGVGDDAGKVHLRNFSAKDGTRKVVPLWTEGAGDLTIESTSPPTLIVKLARSPKESSPARSKWLLDVVVPPGGAAGNFGEESVIILRSPSIPPRRIRIPVVGVAGQG